MNIKHRFWIVAYDVRFFHVVSQICVTKSIRKDHSWLDSALCYQTALGLGLKKILSAY